MTQGLNSPDAKRPRGGRSPVPDDAEMPDKPQLRLPKERGALGRDSGGSGDRPSAPRAAPGRRITALSPDGDTPAKQRLLHAKLVDKRHTEEVGPVSDKRQKDDRSFSQQSWDDGSWWHSSNWRTASSSWSWN